jgi:hypothetical protein
LLGLTPWGMSAGRMSDGWLIRKVPPRTGAADCGPATVGVSAERGQVPGAAIPLHAASRKAPALKANERCKRARRVDPWRTASEARAAWAGVPDERDT